MVVTLVVLTFAVFIALDYFVLSKRRATAPAAAAAVPERGPLQVTGLPIPAGIFLHPTFTWGRFGRAGELYLGVHPMLTRLVGEACELEYRAEGEQVAKGEPLVVLKRPGRRLTVRSPIAGRVEHVNTHLTSETQWRDLEENNGGWLYRLRPARVDDEVPRWFEGEQAAEWTRRQYQQLRAYLHDAVMGGHLGPVMADGGELPIGILGDMDARVWAGLQERFLAHD